MLRFSTSIELETIKKRADFLKVRNGRRWTTQSLILQTRVRNGAPAKDLDEHGNETARFGFIVTKRIGNAVQRNRVKRRLREAVRILEADYATPGSDYVIVARQTTKLMPFESILTDLKSAFAEVNNNKRRNSRHRRIARTET